MLIRYVQRAAMSAGAVIAALLFFLCGFALRLALGPISLGPFTGAIEDSINRSVSGLIVRFDQAVLEWSRPEGRINLAITGTRVFRPDGRLIAHAPKADLDFDAEALFTGTFALQRFALVGVQMTAVRSNDGALRLGFGPGPSDTDLLETIRLTLQRSSAAGSTLQTFAIQDARLAYRDDPTGLFIISPDTDFSVENSGGGMIATLDAAVEISGAPARIAASAELDGDGVPRTATVALDGLDLAALAANSGSFAMLAPFEVTTNLDATLDFAPGGAFTGLEFQVHGSGVAGADANAPLARLDGIALKGGYEAASGRLTLATMTFSGDNTSAAGSGAVTLTWSDGGIAAAEGEITLSGVRLVTPLFEEPLVLDSATAEAAYDRASSTLEWRRLILRGAGLDAQLSGKTVFAAGASPAISARGTIAAFTSGDVLRYWPKDVGSGARSWIADNIGAGMLGPVFVAVDLAPGALDSEPLPEESLSLTFPFEGLSARYMTGLTPITRASGEAQLSGNTFRASVADADVGVLKVSNGIVHIPNLHIRHSPGDFSAHIEGTMADVLALIDMEPLGYARRFNVAPAETGGNAAVDLQATIPMRRNLDIADVSIVVGANVTGLALQIDEKRHFDNGMARFDVDTKRLRAEGTGTISQVPVSFVWNETFANDGQTTHVDLSGTLDDAAREKLGLTEPAWISGPIAVRLGLRGTRFQFQEASAEADFTPADMNVEDFNLKKARGSPAHGSAQLRFLPDGSGVAISNLSITGGPLDVRGDLVLDGNGDVVQASFPSVSDGAANRFSLQANRMSQGGLSVAVQGESLDASQLFFAAGGKPETAVPETDAPKEPLSVTANLRKVALRDGLSVDDLTLLLELGAGERLNAFSIDARGPGQGKLSGRLVTDSAARHLTVDSDIAGPLIYGLTGFGRVLGGTLKLAATFPPAGQAGGEDYSGTLTLENFSVVDQPFVARLLAAGTLEEPLELLQGEGISISRLEAPFSARAGTITISEGRASGTALGFTFAGTVDRDADQVNLSGSLVPLFGLNSALGAVPLLGDLLVSKQGEGIFGLTYAMRGDIDEPGITVNPLSMLTPGIFRRIFEFSTPPAPQANTPAPPSPAQP